MKFGQAAREEPPAGDSELGKDLADDRLGVGSRIADLAGTAGRVFGLRMELMASDLAAAWVCLDILYISRNTSAGLLALLQFRAHCARRRGRR